MNDELIPIREDSFYQAVRSILFKLTKGEAPDVSQMNAKDRKLLEDAIHSDGIEELFETGKHIDVDIFSDEHLLRKGRIMRSIIGMEVEHKSFGKGVVRQIEDDFIFIMFKEEHQFHFPSAFEKFLIASDSEMQAELVQWSNDNKSNANKDKWELYKRNIIGKKSGGRTAPKSKKILKQNVAFKCNYCDGGKNADRIGYYGACSDQIIRMNINQEKRTWCIQDSCPCRQYLKGEISRNELDSIFETGEYMCYESQMLRDWKAFAGFKHNGPQKGEAITIKNVSHNALSILTTRLPGSKEQDRVVFAVFLVKDIFEGDYVDEGFVVASSKFRLQLSEDEAKKVRYWEYHSNENDAASPRWGTGLYRYMDDIECAQILRRIAEVKRNSKDEHLARELFEEYCRITRISKEYIGEPEGALRR